MCRLVIHCCKNYQTIGLTTVLIHPYILVTVRNYFKKFGGTASVTIMTDNSFVEGSGNQFGGITVVKFCLREL